MNIEARVIVRTIFAQPSWTMKLVLDYLRRGKAKFDSVYLVFWI